MNAQMRKDLRHAQHDLVDANADLRLARKNLAETKAELEDAQRCLQHAKTATVREMLQDFVKEMKDDLVDDHENVRFAIDDVKDAELQLRTLREERE